MMLLPLPLLFLCPTFSHRTTRPTKSRWAAHPRPDTTPEVQYTGPTMAAVHRNLSAVLAQTVSVLDYGATADCLCKRDSKPIPPFEQACCPH
eukprot:COSAG01_NODE_44927_length_414_cov_0.895238_1_plen_91_part_01